VAKQNLLRVRIPTTSSLLREYFGPLRGLPCWQSKAEFGSWLALDFGQALVKVREGNPNAKSARLRKRHAYVNGEFFLWIEMGEWQYFDQGAYLFDSSQSRKQLRLAALALHSQCLARIGISGKTRETCFEFDLGGRLLVRPGADSEADDPMWHLYAKGYCITLRADGRLEYGESDARSSPEVIRVRSARYALDAS